MSLELDLLRLVRIVTVILATILTYLAYRAHRQRNSKSLLFLSIGFGIIGIGTAIEGIFFEFLGYGILTVHLTESVIVMLALLFMVYSIYGVRD